MVRWPLRLVGVALAAAAGLGVAVSARGDDRASAEAILAPLEHDEAHRAATTDAVKRAREALERATRMRDSNDEPRARLAEGLGLRWAEVARDLARAADAEQTAQLARAGADDAGAQADRERSLLEEAIARQGRLRAELEGVDRTKHGADRTASVGASLDGGASSAPPGPRGRGASGRGARASDAGAVSAEAGAGAGMMP